MPRTARASQGGYCYHVFNQGNGRQNVFHKVDDFRGFVELLHDAGERVPVRLLAYCLMPSHFHLCLWPHDDGDLSAYMQWLLTAHVRRYHQHSGSSGHVWQGRFKAFPIQQDDHLLAVLRYIERNPLRATLVDRAQDWRWSSAALLGGKDAQADDDWPRPILHPGPVPRPAGWLKQVNARQADAEVERLRECLRRGRPYGSPLWTTRTARRLGLESSVRPPGRPRK